MITPLPTQIHPETDQLTCDLKMYICGADELNQYSNFGITHLIRIVNPGASSSQPIWFTGPYLAFEFGDVVSVEDAVALRTKAPSIKDVDAVVTFCKPAMMEIGSKILVSCDYGASRSPALTYVIIADALGQGREKEALKLVLKIRPEAMPNSMVVLLGDELLERSGALMEALREFNAELGNIEDYFVV